MTPFLQHCRWPGILLPFIALGMPGTVTGQSDPCAQLPKPNVTLKRIEEEPRFNLAYTYRTLTDIGTPTGKTGRTILGLTRTQGTVGYTLQTPSSIDTSGRWECLSPQIAVHFGFAPMTVYVAREFPPGSCAHKEIHEHEMRHARAYKEHITRVEKDLQETLTARFGADTPWRGPAGQLRAKLQEEMESRWLPYIQRLIKQADFAQGEIDTDAEYERVGNACNGEIRNRLAEKQTLTSTLR